MYRRILLALALASAVLAAPLRAQENLNWAYYGSDPASTKFSAATQIDTANFDSLRIIWRQPKGSAAEGRFRYIAHAPQFRGPRGLPMTKPPYSRITAIDLHSGEHAWVRNTGRGPVDHPDIRHLGLENLGWNNRRFAIATPNLILSVSESLRGGGDYWKRPERHLAAYHPLDGRPVGHVPLPDYSYGGPMTYIAGGRQYVVVPVGSRDRAELVALAVPRPGEQLPPQLAQRQDAEHGRFYEAVALMDSGNVKALERLLRAEGETLIQARGYLNEVYHDGYFQGASLLHHVAANPTRTLLPEDHLEVVRTLLAAGAEPNAVTHEGLHGSRTGCRQRPIAAAEYERGGVARSYQ